MLLRFRFLGRKDINIFRRWYGFHWSDKRVSELREACRDRGLLVSGAKPVLVERLQAYDNAGGVVGKPRLAGLETSEVGSRSPKNDGAKNELDVKDAPYAAILPYESLPGDFWDHDGPDRPKITVVVTEKPSVAQDLANILFPSRTPHSDRGFLGDDPDGSSPTHKVVVTWALGHLFDFRNADSSTWSLDLLPILPEAFDVVHSKSPVLRKQFVIIKRLLNRANLVINACDAGREGELIFRLIYHKAGAKARVQRLWLSSQTDDEIRRGFRELRNGHEFNSLFHCGLARKEADWLVGVNATQAYSLGFGRGVLRGVLSLGRVQTPVLSMIVDRHLARLSHTPQKSWSVEMLVNVQDRKHGACTTLAFSLAQKHLVRRFERANEAEEAVKSIPPSIRISHIQTRDEISEPPLLLDLTSLQRAASTSHGLPAWKTLAVAQRLYERKLITYPRTNSCFLPASMAGEVSAIINSVVHHFPEHVRQLLPNRLAVGNTRVFDDSKVSDHYALLPTSFALRAIQGQPLTALNLDPDEMRVYSLILHRFLSAFGEDRVTRIYTVNASSADFEVVHSSRLIIQPGWSRPLKVPTSLDPSPAAKTAADDESFAESNTSPPSSLSLYSPVMDLKKGQVLELFGSAKVLEHVTAAPPAHTDASILALMTEANVGLTSGSASGLEGVVNSSGLKSGRKFSKKAASLTELSSTDMEDAGVYFDRNYSEEPAEAEAVASAAGAPDLKNLDYHKGLGTAATRAATLERLVSAGYIRREGRSLVPTDKGVQIVTLVREVSPALANPMFTARWEAWLESIRDGTSPRREFLGAVKGYVRALVERVRSKALAMSVASDSNGAASEGGDKAPSLRRRKDSLDSKTASAASLGWCRKCNSGEIQTKPTWRLWKCSNAQCSMKIFKMVAGRTLKDEEVSQLLREGRTVRLSGFKSRKSGSEFSAKLVLSKDCETVFEFD